MVRPIITNIGMATYEVAKYLNKLLILFPAGYKMISM